jgi:hypothetical protein
MTINLKQITRKLANAEGAEVAEAALVLPLVFMLLLGIVWFGRVFNIYSTIQQAAQQGAIAAARATCATCGDNPNSAVYTTITAVMQASSLDPTQIQLPPPPNCAAGLPCTSCPLPWPPGGCPTPTSGSIYVCQNVQLNPVAGTQTQPTQCGAVVSFQYPFTFNLPFTSLNMSQVILSAQAESRMED